MEADAIRQTLSALPIDANPEAGLSWSSWSRCESSFSLLLVPHLPGVFALAEEVAAPAGSRRMLALFQVAEAEDLARALSRLFVAESPVRRHLQEGRCYMRYAEIPDAGRRRAVAAALEQWLSAASDSALSSAGASPAVARPPSAAASDVNRQSRDLRPSPLPAGF